MNAHWRLSAVELAEQVRQGAVSPEQAVEAGWQEPAAAWEPQVRAIVHQDRETRHEAARRAPDGPLRGVPIVVKDNICTTDYPTTCGSKILADYRPPYDATVIARLRAAGAVVTGKGNMDEFGMGSSTEFSRFGATHNPYDLERVAGGSSGGPAAAVAYGLAPVGLGSDTGGSVRQPAAFCNVYGLKPTYGRLSRYGLVAFGSSLDQIGLFARHVADLAVVFAAAAGADPFDATTRLGDPPDVSDWDQGVEGLRFGWPDALWRDDVDPEIVESMREAAEHLERCGAIRVPLEFVPGEAGVAAYYMIATAEASSNLARFDGVRYGERDPGGLDLMSLYARTRGEGFGPEVRRRVLLGTYVLSAGYYDAYYLKAQRARTFIARQFDDAFRQCDVLLLPTSPTLPFKLGEKLDDPLAMYLSDIFTIGANLAGIPGLTVPMTLSRAGLPRAVQLVGPEDGEATLLRAARALEVRGERGRLGCDDTREFTWPTKPS